MDMPKSSANQSLAAVTTSACNLESYLTESRLIRLVRQQPALYDRRHRHFTDDIFKEKLWQNIARQLSLQLTKCLSTWAELRYKYQQHVHRMRGYRRKMQACRDNKRARPTMLHEEDLLFLYTHVARHPVQCGKPGDGHNVDLAGLDDEVTIVPMEPVDIIDLDTVDCDQYKISADQERLIEAVRAYRQLYDPRHSEYNNYHHRGIIWSAISNELREKATKLMKNWLLLQTRYEWELLHPLEVSHQLHTLMGFLAPYIPETPGTVCKMSLYLQDNWHDPVENFRSVMSLINALKIMPELGQIVDNYQDVEQKPARYHELWMCVGSQISCTYQRCEVTWLMLRRFYLELTEMRKVGYQLHDKWFFENIIGCLYKALNTHVPRRAKKRDGSTGFTGGSPPKIKSPVTMTNMVNSVLRTAMLTSKLPAQPVPPLPLAIVYPACTRALPMGSSITAVTSTSGISVSISTSSSSINTTTSIPAFTIPRITAAISVVSKPPVTAATKMPTPSQTPMQMTTPTLSTGFMNMLPNQALALPIPATVQLASVSGVRPRPLHTGLQVVVRPKLRLPLAPLMPPVITMPAPAATISGTTIRAVSPAHTYASAAVPAGTIMQAITPPPRGLSHLPALATLASSSTAIPIAQPLPALGPPVPKLVPLTVRTDKVTLTAAAVLSRPWSASTLTPISSATTATLTTKSTSTFSASQMPPLTATTFMQNHQSAMEDTHTPPSTIKCIKIPSGRPKLTMAKSAPSPDNITVEFRDCPQTGRIIFVDGRALPFPSHLNMPRTAVFIREVMAIPQLHSTEPHLMAKSSLLWQQISKKMHIPEHACRAIWAFLVKNMRLFPTIAPMVELMRPFKSNMRVWEKSHRLFSKFDEIARKYEWMLNKDKLPALMQHFQKYEHLYWDMRRPRPGECTYPLRPPRQFTENERQEVWRLARERFPNMNHRDVWSMFKFAFKTYMEDLERGIENPWPQNWWHALEKLKFLVNVRYYPLEPYYYIVHNKCVEEVKRCSMYEALMQPGTSGAQCNVEDAYAPMPWETEEAKRLLAPEIPVPQQQQAEMEPQQKQQPENELEWEEGKQQVSIESELRLDDTRPTMHEVVKLKAGVVPKLPTMDAFQMTRLMRCHPKTFGKASTMEKRSAWLHVAKQLNCTVTECRLSLQHALRELRVLKIIDSNCRCVLSQKYHYHINEIYKQVKIGGQVLVRTPHQLNKTLMQPMETIYPERYLPEINMVTCSTSLVVKNWAYAVSNLPVCSQDDIRIRLTKIFAKYASQANIQWPPAVETRRRNSTTPKSSPEKRAKLEEQA